MKKPFFVSFYSYKGGVGRTLALANVAYLLASEGRKVVLVDFDLEAPGLHTYPFPQRDHTRGGVLDFIVEYMRRKEIPQLKDFATFGTGKVYQNIAFIPAGKLDADYPRNLGSLDIDRLYDKFLGYRFFENFKKQAAALFKDTDYVLIDSRTGECDSAFICTHQIPDCVVLFFAMNEQNEQGIKKHYLGIKQFEDPKDPLKTIDVIPVASPVGEGVPDLKKERQTKFQDIFKDLLILEIPYHPIFYYKEEIVFESALEVERVAKAYRTLVLKIKETAGPAKRTIFVAMPEEQQYQEFFSRSLIPHLKYSFPRLEPVTNKMIQEGQWYNTMERTIRFCNALIVFVGDYADKIKKEIELAKKYDKPIIPVCTKDFIKPEELSDIECLEIPESGFGSDLLKEITLALKKEVLGIYEQCDFRARLHRGMCILQKVDDILFDPEALVESPKNLTEEEPHELITAKKFYNKGQFDEATQVLEKYLTGHPDCSNEAIYWLLSDCWFLKGEGEKEDWKKREYYEKCRDIAAQGLEHSPESFLLEKNKGIGLIKTGELDAGKKLFEELLEEFPDMSVVNYNLACIAALENNIGGVLNYLKKAIALDNGVKMLARIDPDFDNVWGNVHFQRLIFKEPSAVSENTPD